MSLKKEYEACATKYVDRFCKKQGMEFDYWASDIIGGIACFGDYCFNYHDIVWDINSKQPKGLILKWHDGVFLYEDNAEIIATFENDRLVCRHSFNTFYSYTKNIKP